MFKELIEPFRQPTPPSGVLRNPAGAEGRRYQSEKLVWHVRTDMGLSGSSWATKLMLVLFMVLLSSGLALLGPYLVGVAVDDFLEGPGGRTWIYFLIGLGAVYLLNSLTSWLQNIWMIEIAQETVYRMRFDLFSHLHRLPIPFYSKRQQGEIMSRLTNDIENVSSTLNSSAIQIFSSILTLIGTLTVMLWLSPLLTLLTFIVVPLMAAGMRWITRRTGTYIRNDRRMWAN